MSEFTPAKSVNPWNEGDYRVYAFAIPSPEGGYWPAYRIERIQGILDAPKEAAALHPVEAQTYVSQRLAKMMGVSHGVQRVRTNDDLSC